MSDGTGEIVKAITDFGINLNTKMDNLGERMRTDMQDLGRTLGSKIDILEGTVSDLRVDVGRTDVASKSQGREIGELKSNLGKVTDKVDTVPSRMNNAIQSHKDACQRERDRLEDASGVVEPTAADREVRVVRQSEIWKTIKPILPYIIAAILSALAGSGVTIAINDNDPLNQLRPSTSKVDRNQQPVTQPGGEYISDPEE